MCCAYWSIEKRARCTWVMHEHERLPDGANAKKKNTHKKWRSECRCRRSILPPVIPLHVIISSNHLFALQNNVHQHHTNYPFKCNRAFANTWLITAGMLGMIHLHGCSLFCSSPGLFASAVNDKKRPVFCHFLLFCVCKPQSTRHYHYISMWRWGKWVTSLFLHYFFRDKARAMLFTFAFLWN